MFDFVNLTLTRIAFGGIFDTVDGGFSRYSVDNKWHVPHFEKMLYDNAQLISLYAKAFQQTQNSFYKAVVEKTIAFVERELRNSNGGFYASIDADSEHEEGKFYVFTKQEIESVLDEKNCEILLKFYHITEKGNWEEGKNILHYTVDISEFAKENGLTTVEFETILQKAHQQLANRYSFCHLQSNSNNLDSHLHTSPIL